jgi:hypothetical protein
MSTPQFETERRGLIRATLGALVIAAVPGAAATPPVHDHQKGVTAAW